MRSQERELIEDATVKIKALMSGISNNMRHEEVEKAYETVFSAAVNAKEYQFICDYASYLYKQKKYPKAITIAEKLSYLYANPDANIADWEKAAILNLLGTMYLGNNDYRNSEASYEKSLKIYQRLAETVSKEAYEPDVAMTCNNLAALYKNTGRLEDAEKLYVEALEIYRRLAETVSKEAYEPEVAMICNNLAILYSDTGRLEDAEKLYVEALEIRRRLAETVSKEAYEPNVAATCNNLAVLYKNTGRSEDVEKLLTEAFSIAEKYKESNPICAKIYDVLKG